MTELIDGSKIRDIISVLGLIKSQFYLLIRLSVVGYITTFESQIV